MRSRSISSSNCACADSSSESIQITLTTSLVLVVVPRDRLVIFHCLCSIQITVFYLHCLNFGLQCLSLAQKFISLKVSYEVRPLNAIGNRTTMFENKVVVCLYACALPWRKRGCSCSLMEASKMETNTRDYTRVSTASSLVPFERLPNLPDPVIPHIDLGIAHVDVDYLALVLAE